MLNVAYLHSFPLLLEVHVFRAFLSDQDFPVLLEFLLFLVPLQIQKILDLL
jgi:hypothetical protein